MVSGIRPDLWGNNADFRFAQLGPTITEQLGLAYNAQSDEILALEPESAQEILNALRAVLSENARWALVVPGRGLRAVVRGLLELEYPNIPVVGMKELMPGLGNKIERVIDV